MIIGEKQPDDEYEFSEREREWRQTLDRAYASIRSGLVESGYKSLRELIAKHDDSDEVQFWLVENMLDWEDKSHALQVAANLIVGLVGREDFNSALDLYKRCRGHGKLVLQDDVASSLSAFAESIGWDGLASELTPSGISPVRSGL